MIAYLDTSAALKLLVEEHESEHVAEYLSGTPNLDIVASMLLHTELHCASQRRAAISPALVNAVLRGVDLADATRSDFLVAAALPGRLRSADALHLATAIRLEADILVTYDAEMGVAAIQAGLTVESPGAGQ
ncbi:type II toxin-antitoxin system VapC family toxin [uncultured Arthrobacter sp.]|uniref:type II toxin-antitoxin system VapC family toxin n=1 Tax=uncultured Arthrobacter sp. TaxID=114050 RepID=UPI0026060F7E|nr:type II toxin-antitoxin system VapC family toxin [uncultured Arthrobacter sp.]